MKETVYGKPYLRPDLTDAKTPQQRVKAAEQLVAELFAKLRELRVQVYIVDTKDGICISITKPGRKLSVVTDKE